MTAKQIMLQAVQELPDGASFEDAMERLFFLSKIEKGLEQADREETVPHTMVKEKMAKWLK